MHGSYHQPGDAVSDNACVQWLPGCRSTLRYVHHAGGPFRHVKSERPSTDLCDLCFHTDNPELPEVILLYALLQTLPSLNLHNHLPGQEYP